MRSMNKLPHEIQQMCDDCEDAADFLQQFGAPFGDGEEQPCMIMHPNGNPWPIDAELVSKWEQAIRNLKQMVVNMK